ncbi:hypothetical protein INT43_008734 [Umbelopsis isabellina]|uniref:Zn(2)-C6 fungal-type domain-containing protein n=1 Tax=Mortierella isabellina TaxID=91625 RepID=A0A8H7PVM9_MORIS|nr:hypothetical protein INT43_008734 [Umbelopsis isabellina]
MNNNSNNDSQFGENGVGSKRKRLTQACDVCRRKKIKCDGVKPACGNCVRMKQECSYIPSNKKRGPRQGYIELLEKRLDKMEKLLQNSPADGSPEETAAPDYEIPPYQSAKKARQFSTDSDDHGKSYGNGKSNSMDYSPAPSPTSASSRLSQFSPILSHSSNSLTSRSQTDDVMPSPEIIEHLVAVFFEHLYPMMPILHPKFFMEKIRKKQCPEVLLLSVMALAARSDVLENPPWYSGEKYASRARKIINGIFDYPSVTSAQALLLLGIYEFGCSRGPRSWMFLGMSLRMCVELGLNKESLSEMEFNSPISEEEWVEKESRRRLFWQAYIVDILACANSGRPTAISELDCQILLPSDDECWTNSLLYTETLDGSCSVRFTQTGSGEIIGSMFDNNKLPQSMRNDQSSRPSLSITAYLARTSTILARIAAYINRSKVRDLNLIKEKRDEISGLDEALTSLYKKLPDYFKFTDDNLEVFRNSTPAEFHALVMLHGLLSTATLLLYRPSLILDNASENDILQTWIRQHIDTAKLKCKQSCDRIIQILNVCVAEEPKIMVPLLSYSAFVSCTVLVNDAFCDDAAQVENAKRSLAVAFRYLLTIRPFWSIADRFYFMARDLYGLRSKISGKGKFNICPQLSQEEMLQSTGKGDNKVGQEKSKKVQLPVHTDSGFVALWQMATLQQQSQEYQNRKEGSEQDESNDPVTLVAKHQHDLENRMSNYESGLSTSNNNNSQMMINDLPTTPFKYLEQNLTDTNNSNNTAAFPEYFGNKMSSNPAEFSNTGLDIPGNDPMGFNFLFDGSLLNDMVFPVMWPGSEDNIMSDIPLSTNNWTLDNSNLLSMPDERPFNVNSIANNSTPLQQNYDKQYMQNRGSIASQLSSPP